MVAQVTGSPASSAFVSIFGAVAVALTTLIGLVTAVTGLVKLVHRPAAEAAHKAAADEDGAHETRAWLETLEQLEAANDRADAETARADRAEAEAHEWRDKYVRVLEEGHRAGDARRKPRP